MFTFRTHGAVNVIEGNESLNLEHVAEVEEILKECEQHGQTRIVVDLSQVPLIDSSGLELLLDLRERCLKRGGLVKLANPNHLCGDILRITGVEQQFEIFEDSVSAVGSFAQ